MKGEAMRRKTEKVTNCDYISMKSPEKKKRKKKPIKQEVDL